MTTRTLIIAEAGVNHNGDMGLAHALVDAAAEAGADLVKFQTFRSGKLASKAAGLAGYQAKQIGAAGNQQTMLEKLELTADMHSVLIERCRTRGIGFLSTSFDTESLGLLVQLGTKLFKIPSGAVTDLPHLRQVGALDGDILFSTGMATLGEIEAAIGVLEEAGTPRDRITVLHCTTEYPAPMAEVNLRAMLTIGAAFRVKIGYSDHTSGIAIPVAAVALGATVIEKHFTMDRSLPGPDHKASLEPAELTAMVSAIRNVEVALGDGIKRPTASELSNLASVRKSLVASRHINAGEKFSPDNLAAKRPGHGITPMRWDEVVGRTAPRDFAEDELIEL